MAGSDPAAREGLIAGFGSWQGRLPAGLRAMRDREELAADADADPDALALALLAAAQGGLLLARTTGSVVPLKQPSTSP